MRRWFAPMLAFLIAGCATAGPTVAQTSAADAPPLIAGRLALVEGDAQIWRVEEDEAAGQWDVAEPNDVISAGTGLYTGNDGRGEVRVGPNTFRLAPNSRGGFTQLDYADAVFNLEYGVLNVRLAPAEHGERTAVTAGGARLELSAPGRYRIDADDGGAVRLSVFEGHGTVRSAHNAIGVAASQAIVVAAGGTRFDFETAVASGFDQWALARDDRYRGIRSEQYVSPYMTGYEELDRYGDWSNDATYGAVWYPRAVPVGWAPYRDGRWRWVRPWGWTWVDHAPWGYAPFHYGRWVQIGPRWCWVPGGYIRRPVWAPALVGFVGSGVSVSVSFGAPVVGWYPLAPWHRYEPHYRHNRNYVTIVNQTVIQRPPRGVPPNVNHRPGATMVPGPRFRDPIMRVALPVQPRPEQLKPSAPPPLNVAPAPRPTKHKFADNDRRGPASGSGAPNGAPPPRAAQPMPAPAGSPPATSPPPTRVRPSIVAEPVPGRGVAPAPSLPGNDPAPLAQPPGLKRAVPAPHERAASPAPPAAMTRPAPRAHMPSEQIPPGQPKPINPAEPPQFPPGAPPTIRAPMVPPPRPVPSAPPARSPASAPPATAAPPMVRTAPPAARPTPAPVAAPVAAPAPAPRAVAAPKPAPRSVPEPDIGKPERGGPKPRQVER